MIHRRQAFQTVPVETVTEASPYEVTIFAEVRVPTPSVGSVWGAFFNGNQKVAEDFVPGSAHVIYGVTFEVDNGWEAVTWAQDGVVLGSRNLPIVIPATTADQASDATAGPSGTTAGASDAPSSGSNTGAASASGTGTSDPPPSDKPKSKGSIGPIVGGAVGGVAALAIIIFLVWFLLRKRRRQASAGSAQQLGPSHTGDDKYPVEGYAPVSPHQAALSPTTNETYPMGQHVGAGATQTVPAPSTTEKYVFEYAPAPQHNTIPDLPHNDINQSGIPAHELDPARDTTAVMHASELGYGVGQQPPTGIKRVPVPASELQSGNQDAMFRQELGDDRSPAEYATQSPPQPQHQEQAPSPYVDAQRRREIEWLESEEAKLRSRRELLRKQGGE